MWIKTAAGNLVNLDKIPYMEVCTDNAQWAISSSKYNIATGTRDEMLAVLDRIARGIAAGVPLLDLGHPEEPLPCNIGAILKRYGATNMVVWLDDDRFHAEAGSKYTQDCRLIGYGPTPDAAIANLKPTGK